MIEMIGLIISLLAIIYLLGKQNLSPSHQIDRVSDEEELDAKQKFLERAPITRQMSLKGNKSKQKHQSPPPSKAVQKQKKVRFKSEVTPLLEEDRLLSDLKDHSLRRSLEEQHFKSRSHYQTNVLGRSFAFSDRHQRKSRDSLKLTRINRAMQHLTHRKYMVLYQEIMAKPKSLRTDNFFYE